MTINKYLNSSYGAATKAFRDAGGYVLSPSGTGKFFNEPDGWIDDREGKIVFDGNTQTAIGTIVHAMIEAYFNGDTILYGEVEEWLETKFIDNEKVDIDVVLANYEEMFTAWETGYATMYPAPDNREMDIRLDLADNIRLAGTVDGYEADRCVMIDWKTCDSKPSKIKKSHEIQLMMYALAMIADGKDVKTIRVCYIQRATKTISARIWTYDIDVSDKMLIEANYYLQLQKESLELYFENPKLRPIIFRPNPIASWLN